MRIGLFTDTYTPDINGVVSSIVTLQRELEKNGHDVYVITNHKAMTMKKEGNVLRLPGLELKWLYGYKLSTPYHFSARDEIRKMQLDVIHVHTEFGVGMFGRIVAKYLNIPVVTTYHTMYEDYTHYVNRFEIDEVDKVTKKVVSTFSRSISASAPARVQEIRRQYGIQEDERLIVFVGRIAQEKSIEIPIEGFRYVSDTKIKLMIVGGGPQLEELQKLVQRHHLERQVIFTDKKLPEEIPAYYACADCFVSASLTETQGMTYIEALACGLPVFARYDDVLKDLVIEEDSGFLFETPQEFAEKLTDFMHRSAEERKAFSRRALSKIVKYDSRVFYSKVLSVYYQAINDFEDAYEVIKIKTLDDYVRIYVQNDKEDQPQKLLIDLDDYFTYKIRLHTMLDRYTVAHFQRKEIVLEAYRGAIRKLRMRDYTRKEMGTWLHRQPGLSVEDVEGLLSELEEKGYINDNLYMQQKIEKMQFSLSGKGNIRRTLINKGISAEDVDEALSGLDDEEERLRALKMAEKLMATIKDKSRKMKKQTIVQKLISLGFDSDIARSTSERLNFEEEDDSEALNKTIAKAIRTYSRKLSGQPLKNKVLVYCMQKGFLHEDIMNHLNEMEWRDEQ